MLNNKKTKLLALLIICFFGFFAFSQNTYAYDTATILKKWAFTQYYQCVKNGYIVDYLNPSSESGLVAEDVFESGGSLNLLSYGFGWGDEGSNDTTNCRALFNGNDLRYGKSILDYYNGGAYKNTDWSSSDARVFLENIGYSFKSTQAENKRTFEILATSSPTAYPNNRAKVSVTDNGNEYPSYRVEEDFSNLVTMKIKPTSEGGVIEVSPRSQVGINCTFSGTSNRNSIQEIFDWDDIDSFNSALGRLTSNNHQLILSCNYEGTTVTETVSFNNNLLESEDGYFEYPSSASNSYDLTSLAINRMSGMDIRGLNFTPSEFYTLYYYYLNRIIPQSAEPRITCDSSANTNGLTPVNLKDSDGVFRQCYVNLNSVNQNQTLYTQTSSGGLDGKLHPSIDPITINQIIDWFNNVDPNELDDTIPLVGDTISTDTSEENSLCYNESGNMGWVLCGLMERIGNGANELYGAIVEPFLVINPELLETNGATFKAWNVMMGIANTLMVIYLLVVIFSQLTGVGINNYGIKKTLPKMLVAALLINLSFLICQLAVDVSNILGNSLNKALTDIASNIDVDLHAVSGIGSNAAGWFNGLLAGATGGLAAIGVASVATSVLSFGSFGLLSGLLIPILMLLITVIISILFFFVLLGLRKAGVVIFVILAPLAFACYMLPNTKSYFDKWYKIFKGLLLVYPICGLLIGGGYLTSKILLSVNQDYIMYFTGCIAIVVPFFFVPKILKGSFAALGNLGATLSGMSKRIGNWGGNTLKGSVEKMPGYQSRLEAGKSYANYKNAARQMKRLEEKNGDDPSKWKSQRDRSRYASAMDTVKAYEASDSRAKIIKDTAEAERFSKEAKVFQDMYASTPDELEKDIKNVASWATSENENVEERATGIINELSANGRYKEAMKLLKDIDEVRKDAGGSAKFARLRKTLSNSESGILSAWARSRTKEGNEKYSFSDFCKAGDGLEAWSKDKGEKWAASLSSKDISYLKDNNLEGVLSNDQMGILLQNQNAKAAQAAVDMAIKNEDTKMTGDVFAGMTHDAARNLWEQAGKAGNTTIMQKMVSAVAAAKQSPQLAAKLDPELVAKIEQWGREHPGAASQQQSTSLPEVGADGMPIRRDW
ncbi:hypothetical protein IKF67_02435 [Candidatus Saccharibacteria bacterium]|nr:hypothetical protein [Candidatus Saccharibacteria bacterium]